MHSAEARPSIFSARSRRSPATSSYLPAAEARTTKGASSPWR